MKAPYQLLELNAHAARLFETFAQDAAALNVSVHQLHGATFVDCGIKSPGGLEAGRRLAELCLAGLGDVSILPAASGSSSNGSAPRNSATRIFVRTDQPVAACLASQYAGWRVAKGDFFAMASGPMRAVAGKEELFQKIGFRETADMLVGVLETSQYPTADVIAYLAESCRVTPDRLLLAGAPTTSLAGCLQIAARSLETALHKLEQLEFDLSRIAAGCGAAPLPDPAPDFIEAIGRTNDVILYHGRVTLWVHGDDASLQAIAPKVPSSASPDFGAPFAEIFRRYNGDFYEIDPLLFSPASVEFVNIDTGSRISA